VLKKGQRENDDLEARIFQDDGRFADSEAVLATYLTLAVKIYTQW